MLDIKFLPWWIPTLKCKLGVAIEPLYIYYIPSTLLGRKIGILISAGVQKDLKLLLDIFLVASVL
jgi:hypothetical protein